MRSCLKGGLNLEGSTILVQDGDMTFNRWQWEIAYRVWPSVPIFRQVLESLPRTTDLRQSIGPVILLLGEDL